MSNRFTPAQLANNATLAFHGDLSKILSKKQELVMLPLRVDGKPFLLTLTGQLSTNGVIVNSQYNTHSLAMKFEDMDDATAIESFQALFVDLPELTEHEYKPMLKNDNLWIKLKPKNDKSGYNVTTNFKINPKKPGDAPLYTFTEITVTAELMGYITTKEDSKSYGFCLNIRDVSLVHPIE